MKLITLKCSLLCLLIEYYTLYKGKLKKGIIICSNYIYIVIIVSYFLHIICNNEYLFIIVRHYSVEIITLYYNQLIDVITQHNYGTLYLLTIL